MICYRVVIIMVLLWGMLLYGIAIDMLMRCYDSVCVCVYCIYSIYVARLCMYVYMMLMNEALYWALCYMHVCSASVLIC